MDSYVNVLCSIMENRVVRMSNTALVIFINCGCSRVFQLFLLAVFATIQLLRCTQLSLMTVPQLVVACISTKSYLHGCEMKSLLSTFLFQDLQRSLRLQ